MAALSLALLFAFGMSMPAFAAPPFELDGNATSNDFPGDDWADINFGSDGNSIARTGLIPDRPEPAFAQFKGGGSKDEQDIPNWAHRSGEPPAKDDITNAYAAAYQNPDDGHLVIVFGMDRFDTSGDAQLGFWFLQDDVRPVAPDDFDGVHEDGDILVLVNFSGGGDVPTIEVFRWQGTGPVSLGAGDEVLCVNGWIPGGEDHCGITNVGNVSAPWTYFNKDVNNGNTPTPTFPDAAFFEGAIDLTALGIAGCFTQFLAESRSSTSITATLKDFVVPAQGFNVCSIEVNKQCANPVLNAAENMITYDISGKVTNTGFGQVFNITLADNPPADGPFQLVDCTDPNIVLGTFPFAGPLAALGEVCYKNTITVPLAQNGIDDTVTVTANTESDGSGVALTAMATADCPTLQVSPNLSIEKECSSAVMVMDAKVVAVVNVEANVCNIGGDSSLNNVTVTDDKAGTLVTSDTMEASITLPKETCRTFVGSYTPSEALDGMGNPTTDPGAVVFTDTATANGDDILGDPVMSQNDTATCPLCP